MLQDEHNRTMEVTCIVPHRPQDVGVSLGAAVWLSTSPCHTWCYLSSHRSGLPMLCGCCIFPFIQQQNEAQRFNLRPPAHAGTAERSAHSSSLPPCPQGLSTCLQVPKQSAAEICLAKTDGEVGSPLANHKLIFFCVKRIVLVEENS